jgi:hypothetical protein
MVSIVSGAALISALQEDDLSEPLRQAEISSHPMIADRRPSPPAATIKSSVEWVEPRRERDRHIIPINGHGREGPWPPIRRCRTVTSRRRLTHTRPPARRPGTRDARSEHTDRNRIAPNPSADRIELDRARTANAAGEVW